jgi:RecG-like helicase
MLEHNRVTEPKNVHPIQFVKGVGPRLGEKLAARGIRTPHDALYFFPKDYEDRRKVIPIRDLKAGMTVPAGRSFPCRAEQRGSARCGSSK